MALAGSLGHRETRMGTTDLGSVQLSKTRVKPTSCHWDSHNGVKPNKILLSFTPWVTYLDLWKKICTPMHLYVLVHICIDTHRDTCLYTDYHLLHTFSWLGDHMQWSGSILRNKKKNHLLFFITLSRFIILTSINTANGVSHTSYHYDPLQANTKPQMRTASASEHSLFQC